MDVITLEPWEQFQAQCGPRPALTTPPPTTLITHVWVDGTRILGVGPQRREPLHLSPRAVPGRIMRGTPASPKSPDEWREVFQAASSRASADADEILAARLAAIPEPEVRARPASLQEVPATMRRLGKLAHAAGFTQRMTYSRGPRLNQHWQVVEISDDVMLKGEHPDGRRFVITYVTKTPGEGAKGAGVPAWKPDIGYAMVEGLWTSCGPTALEAYFTNGSLTKESP
jgi:hypothetical protein